MPTVYLIVEDQDERASLAALLRSRDWSVEDFAHFDSFLGAASSTASACVIVDLPFSADRVVRRLRSLPQSFPVIVLCAHASVALAVRAMKEGAADILEKPVDAMRLLAVTRSAIDDARARAARTYETQARLALFNALRPRERDVVDAIVDGCGNREVAARLGIKPRTVETHRASAMTKLGARTLVDLVRIRLDVDHALKRLPAK
jgi:two-component system, LuxR family, response regulator FixJ